MNALPQKPSDWTDALREAVEENGMRRVAAKIGYSTAVVSTVLNGKYRGNIAHVEMAVRGALMSECVNCPVYGEHSKEKCRRYQAAPFSNRNPQSIAIYRACRQGCPNSRHTKGV
jgi:ribosome-binding protein aMBF1 (putative translation factor)